MIQCSHKHCVSKLPCGRSRRELHSKNNRYAASERAAEKERKDTMKKLFSVTIAFAMLLSIFTCEPPRSVKARPPTFMNLPPFIEKR